jgi:hypothetical protein
MTANAASRPRGHCLLLMACLAACLAAGASPVEEAAVASAPSWALRSLVVLIALAGWHLTQAKIGKRPPLPADEATKAGSLLARHDAVLKLSAPVNRFLNEHPRWASALLALSTALIDLLGLFLLVAGIVGPSFRPVLGLLILFGLRQLCQVLTTLPPPPGMIWRSPGIPSLFVTYGVANDLFFSGHTALAVYGVVELARFGPDWVILPAVALALFQSATVLVLRAHYTLDTFTGAVTALFVAGIADRLSPFCDQLLR